MKRPVVHKLQNATRKRMNKTFIFTAALLSSTLLSANTSEIEIQTFAASCAETANGSVYMRAENTNWNMDVYRNAMLLNTINVAGADTFLSGLAKGCYTFVYNAADGSTATINKVVAAPVPVVASCVITKTGNSSVRFTNCSSGAFAFDWDFGDGEHSAELSPEHKYHFPGTYTVTLNAYNRAGCTTEVMYTVTILPDLQPGMNREINSTPTILFESADGQVMISNTGTNAIKQLTVYSITGQMIYSGDGNVTAFSYASPGFYTAHIVYDNGEQESKILPLK